MPKVGLSVFGALLLVLATGTVFAADEIEADVAAKPSVQVPTSTTEDQCGAGLESDAITFAGEIKGIKYSHIEICSCRTDADCDEACGEEGGVCKVLDTVPCPPPMPSGSCLCGAVESEPQRLSASD